MRSHVKKHVVPPDRPVLEGSAAIVSAREKSVAMMAVVANAATAAPVTAVQTVLASNVVVAP